MTERLLLLDTASLYFRAFFGVPDSVRSPDGTPVNAVRGLLDMIARLVTDFEPTAVVACWDDAWRPQWRVELIPSYKQHRVAEEVDGGVDIEITPDGLVQQIPLIRTVLEALGIVIVGARDHEADDVIGTLASRCDGPVDVVTGDRDLFQLVDDSAGIRIVYTAKGMSKLELVTDDVVLKKYGVPATSYVDYAVLRGDSSDGLPGVAGIGEKTAASLINEYGTLAAITAAADGDGPMSASVRGKLCAASDYLAVAPRVVQVVRDLDIGDVDARLHPLEPEQIAAIDQLATEWGLGGSAQRAVQAVQNAASR